MRNSLTVLSDVSDTGFGCEEGYQSRNRLRYPLKKSPDVDTQFNLVDSHIHYLLNLG